MNGLFFNFKYIYSEISKNFRLRFFLLCFLMIISALLELFSIASLVPFLQKILFVKQESKIIFFDNLFINNKLYQENKFFIITIFFLGFILLSLLFRMFALKLTFNFTKIIGLHFSSLVVKKTLDLSYVKYKSMNSGDLIAMLETKIDRVADFVYYTLEVLSSLIILIFIFTGLVFINTKISIIILIFLLFFYFVMFNIFF